MKVGQYCHRGVVVIDVAADIAEAAKLMRTQHVGFLVVLDARDSLRKPVGVLTDRDIVIQIERVEPTEVVASRRGDDTQAGDRVRAR